MTSTQAVYFRQLCGLSDPNGILAMRVADVEALLDEIESGVAKLAAVEKLAEEWRYKGEFGSGPWQLGEGPDPEEHELDYASSQLRKILGGQS